MTVRRGDVVLVRFPFSSGTGNKARPALVVQSDHNNARLTNTIVVQITTNTRRVGEPTQVFIDPSTADGQLSGLLSPSAITCENLATLEGSRIIRSIGNLSDATMQRVNAALIASLGL